MQLVFLIDPDLKVYLNRIGYVLDFLKNHPFAQGLGIEILINPPRLPVGAKVMAYGRTGHTNYAWQIPAQRTLFAVQKVDWQTLTVNSYVFGQDLLCSVETQPKTGRLFMEQRPDGVFQFNFDWIETVFFHLSRCEEYRAAGTLLDEHGNCLESALLLPRCGLHHRPVADELVAGIYRALDVPVSLPPTRFALTHDVDNLRLFSTPLQLLRFLGARLLRDRTTEGLTDTLKAYYRHRYRGEKDPYDTFDWLLTDQNRFEKTVYFPSGVRRDRRDPAYTLDDPAAQYVLKLAQAKNYTVGIHPGYRSWRSREIFEDDVRRLENWTGRPVRHTRQHFLHFHFPDTLQIIEQAGMAEDSTLGYRTRIGFRCGTGFAFHPYNFEQEKAWSWKEKPPVVMDVALLREARFDAERVGELWRSFVQANRFGAQITVLFHNSIFFQPAACGLALRRIYEELVSA